MRWIGRRRARDGVSTPSNNSNGNTFDFQGRQISCEHLTRRVVRYEHDGSITILCDAFDGKRFNSPNDVVAHPDGSYWFTDPPYGGQLYEGQVDEAGGPTNRTGTPQSAPRPAPRSGPHEARVAQWRLSRRCARARSRSSSPKSRCPIPTASPSRPTTRRCTWSAREGPGDTGPGGKGDLFAFDVAANDTLSNQRLFTDFMIDGVKARADGVRCDVVGNVWCSSNAGAPSATVALRYGRPKEADRPHSIARSLRQPLLRRTEAQSPVHGGEPVALRRVCEHAREAGRGRAGLAGKAGRGWRH